MGLGGAGGSLLGPSGGMGGNHEGVGIFPSGETDRRGRHVGDHRGLWEEA